MKTLSIKHLQVLWEDEWRLWPPDRLNKVGSQKIPSLVRQFQMDLVPLRD